MNLKGSHLLYLVLIVYGNYLAYNNSFPWWSYLIEYAVIFILGINFVGLAEDSLDFRIYDDPESAKRAKDDRTSDIDSWDKTDFGHKSFNEIKALQYGGSIFYIITFLPIIPFILLYRFIQYLDKHLTLKA